jgi:hypothetical protein
MDNTAAVIAQGLLELKRHIEAVEARAICAEMMIAALVRTHPNVPALLEEWNRPLDAGETKALRTSPTLRTAFDRLAGFVALYGDGNCRDSARTACKR